MTSYCDVCRSLFGGPHCCHSSTPSEAPERVGQRDNQIHRNSEDAHRPASGEDYHRKTSLRSRLSFPKSGVSPVQRRSASRSAADRRSLSDDRKRKLQTALEHPLDHEHTSSTRFSSKSHALPLSSSRSPSCMKQRSRSADIDRKRRLIAFDGSHHSSTSPSVGHFIPRRSQSSPQWPVSGAKQLAGYSSNKGESLPRKASHFHSSRKLSRDNLKATLNNSLSTETSVGSSSMRSILDRIRVIIRSDEEQYQHLTQNLNSGKTVCREEIPSTQGSIESATYCAENARSSIKENRMPPPKVLPYTTKYPRNASTVRKIGRELVGALPNDERRSSEQQSSPVVCSKEEEAADGGGAFAGDARTSYEAGDSPSVMWEADSNGNPFLTTAQPRSGVLPPRPTPRAITNPSSSRSYTGAVLEERTPAKDPAAFPNPASLNSFSSTAAEAVPLILPSTAHKGCQEIYEKLLREQRREKARGDALGRGFAEICSTVQEDVRRLEGRLKDALRSFTPGDKASKAVEATASCHSKDLLPLLQAVQEASPLEKKNLVRLLMPELKTLIEDEIHTAMRVYHHQEQQQQQRQQVHALESHLKNYIDEKVANLDAQRSSSVQTFLPAAIHSVDKLDEHIRAIARSVLSAEGPSASPGLNSIAALEDRMQRLIQQNSEASTASVNRLEAAWQTQLEDILSREREAWRKQELKPLHRQFNAIDEAVKGFTEDLSELMRSQRAMASQLKQQEAQEEDRKKESARISLLNASASLPERYYSSADCIRLEVVEPALEHVRRLLVAHEKMLNTIVEQRCTKVEHNIEDHLHIWEQSLVGLRTRLNSFQRDVRGALTELCQNLNVACPGI